VQQRIFRNSCTFIFEKMNKKLIVLKNKQFICRSLNYYSSIFYALHFRLCHAIANISRTWFVVHW